ncbi:hypothetical protein BC936DRAFT_145651 [Jimgerdemannia flammicorona]|uniref:Myb-like domain-containing protein n=1 Tax=Jimgerdemannia flammicorona TaxID=994334 RepID=A0A433D9F6_9FUNG|nr:hypothetical protein BC936DRAFT_145651 [Jimgerdemannia flammicorona]
MTTKNLQIQKQNLARSPHKVARPSVGSPNNESDSEGYESFSEEDKDIGDDTVDHTKEPAAQPSKSSIGQLSKSGIGQPSKSGVSQPSKSDVGQPSKSSASQPSKSGIGQLSKSSVSQPVSQPSKSSISQLSRSSVGELSRSGVGEPSRSGISQINPVNNSDYETQLNKKKQIHIETELLSRSGDSEPSRSGIGQINSVNNSDYETQPNKMEQTHIETKPSQTDQTSQYESRRNELMISHQTDSGYSGQLNQITQRKRDYTTFSEEDDYDENQISNGNWSDPKSAVLLALKNYTDLSLESIASHVGHAEDTCKKHWVVIAVDRKEKRRIIDSQLRIKWTRAQDDVLKMLVEKGTSWVQIAAIIPGWDLKRCESKWREIN